MKKIERKYDGLNILIWSVIIFFGVSGIAIAIERYYAHHIDTTLGYF